MTEHTERVNAFQPGTAKLGEDDGASQFCEGLRLGAREPARGPALAPDEELGPPSPAQASENQKTCDRGANYLRVGKPTETSPRLYPGGVDDRPHDLADHRRHGHSFADVGPGRAKVARAVADIRTFESEIALYELLNGRLPDTLADLGRGSLLDPWGNPYQYLNYANANGQGAMRKDRFLVPLNSTYDLYSMGKDGQSVPPITAKVSQDDIIRASDGGYVGLASQY